MNSVKLSMILIGSFILTSCGTVKTNNIKGNTTTQATLWVQNSAEYKALALQTYKTAARVLPLSLQDSFWTASLTQQDNDEYLSLPPAIIMDIDETVLDNSPFQARMIKQGKTFNIEDWNAWCNEGNAGVVPGAIEFTSAVAKKGITIFFVSNRDHEVEDATRQNLTDLGFPVSDSIDNILTNGEKPEWNSSKIERRRMIEENYRVLLVFGDDLNDFLPAKDKTLEERDAMVEKYSNYFGRRWFVLPNPVYGSWDQALYEAEEAQTNEQKAEIQNKRLNTKN